MSYRKKNILGAAALAIVAVVFMLVYISQAKSGSTSSNKSTGSVTVLVAKRQISAGTLGGRIQHGAFEEKKVPADTVVPGALSSVAGLGHEVVTQDILAGQQVSQQQFGPRAASGVRVELRRHERAVELEGDPGQILDGTLRPGDHVDILGAWSSSGRGQVSRTIVRNALVLATSAQLGKSTGSTLAVQVRLSDRQAQRVFWMAKNGQWWLELRPVIHPRSSRPSVDDSLTILRQGG